MYNKSELSKALKQAKAAKSQKKTVDIDVDIKDKGYKNPKNSNKPELKLYTDSIYNPTDKDLMLYPDNGMAPVFKPAWDTTTTFFPGANSIVEKQVARDGGRFVDKNDPGNNALELHMFYDKDLYEDGGEYLDLTDEEIEEYRKGGYVVEELPRAQTAGTTETPQVQTPPNPMTYFDTQKPYTDKSGDPLVLNKLKLQEDAVIPYYNERTGEFTTQEGTFKPDQYEKVEVEPGVFIARFKNRDDIKIDYSMDNEVNKKYYKHYTKGNQYWPIYSTVPYDPLLQQWRAEDAAETVEQPVVTQRKGGYVNNQITHFQKAGTTGGPQAAPMPTGLIPLDAQIKSVSNSPRIEDQRKAEMLRAQKAKEEAEKKKRIEEYKRKEAEKKKQAEAAAKWYDEEKAKRDALGAVMDVAPVQPASSTNVDLEYLVPSVGQRKSQERGLEMLKDQLYEQQETLRRRGFKDAYEYEKSPEGLLRDQALAAEAAWKESGEEAPMVDLGEMAFYDGRAKAANQYTFGPGAKGSYTTDLGTYDSRTGKFTPRTQYYSGSGALKSVDEIWTLPLLATRAPYLAGEGLMGLLSTQIPGTSGATLGQAINAGFLGKGLYDAVPFEYFMPGMEDHQSTPGAWYEAYQSGEGDYRNAMEKTFWNAADFLGAGEAKEGAKLLAQDIKNTGKYLTTQTPLRNAYKINPLAGRLGQYNRVVGQDAVDDILESGLVRVNENAGVAQDLGPLGVVYRQTPYPSFAKAAPQKTYAEQVISEGKTPYIISTNRPMRVSTLGRHGRGSTQFPVDEAGKYMTGFPASEAKVFEFGEPHWLRGYKEVPAEKVLPKYKTNSTLGNQRAFTVQGDIGKGIGTNLTTSDVQRTIDDQLKWITSEEYYKRRSANTGETYDQIFADVNKTIKNAQDAKVYLNAELPGNIGGRQTPRSLNTLWGPPTIEVSRTTANPPMVLKHEVGHLYSPAGFDVSTSKLHRGFDNPNVASLPANKRGVYANYPKIGGDDMDEYLQLGYEQQVRHLNARDQILSKYNLDKEAPLTEDQVYDFVTNWNKKIQNREAGFSDAESNFHFGKEEDYDDIWLNERNQIKQQLKDKYDLNDPQKISQLSREEKNRLTEETNRLLSKKITDVLNKAWVTVPIGVSVGAAVTQEYQKGGALTKAQTGQSTRNANNTIQLADNLNPFSSLYYDPLNNNPLNNNKFIANQAYTYAGRPGSYYKMVDGKMQIKNKDTDWKYVEMKDPTGKRLKTLEAGLKSGSTKVYNKPKATTTINDFYYSKNELQNEQIIDRALQCRSDANGNCLGSAFLYYDKYVAPKLGMKSSWELKESAGLTSGKKGANPNYDAWGESVDSWELRGAFGDKAKQYYAAPLSNPSELYQKLQGMTEAEKDKYFRDMNLPIGTIITGGMGGYDTGKQVGSSYNENKGYVASHHSGIVVGYDDYGTPIIYDYGNVRKISDPSNLLMTSDFPINNIFTPQENVQYTYDYLKKGNKLKQEVTPLNMNIPNIENISDIDEMRPFLDNLEKNKQKIMDTFNMSDSEYNELAKISAATALAETKGGKDFGTWRYGLPAYTLDKAAPFVNKMAQIYTAGLYNPEVGKSAGITQINPESVWALDEKNGWRNPQLVNRLEQLGITRDTYDPWNPYHQAVVTMGLTQSNIKAAKANASKNPNVSKDLSDAELAYYQWNIPSALTTSDYEKAARGENENVQRFMEYYNMLNKPNRQRGGTIEYLTQDEINQLRAGGITVIEE